MLIGLVLHNGTLTGAFSTNQNSQQSTFSLSLNPFSLIPSDSLHLNLCPISLFLFVSLSRHFSPSFPSSIPPPRLSLPHFHSGSTPWAPPSLALSGAGVRGGDPLPEGASGDVAP